METQEAIYDSCVFLKECGGRCIQVTIVISETKRKAQNVKNNRHSDQE